MMLAFYLAAPEVENDRRALNVFYGMRRARKEGRYMGLAPIGYINRTDPNGRKYIAPEEAQADIIRWSFEELAAGRYKTELVWKMAKAKGFKGTRSLYAYYHCFGDCAHRFRADHVNDLLTAELKRYTPNPKSQPLLKSFLCKAYRQQTGRNNDDRKQLTDQIKDLEGKLSKARDLLLSDQIDPADYRAIKVEYEERLNRQQAKLNAVINQPDDFNAILKRGMDNIYRLSEIYETGSIMEKRQVIGLVYPEKLTFDGDQLRTTRINEAVRLIYTLDKELAEKETGQSSKIETLSSQVGKTGRAVLRYAAGIQYVEIIGCPELTYPLTCTDRLKRTSKTNS
jgi:hypothetical protein